MSMDDKTETACRICGYDDGEAVFDEYGVPEYVICPCCYNESGIGDDNGQRVAGPRAAWILGRQRRPMARREVPFS